MTTNAFNLTDLQLLLKRIPHGKVTTYAEIAKALGNPKACRAIGNLVGKNPDPDSFPCCKVVKSSGKVGGFAFGQQDKICRLAREGIEVKHGRVMDFDKRCFFF